MKTTLQYAKPLTRVFRNGVRVGFGLCTFLLMGLSLLVLDSYVDRKPREEEE